MPQPFALSQPRSAPQRAAGVTAAVLLAHLAVLWGVLHHLASPALPGDVDHVIMANVVADMPMVNATPPQPPAPRAPEPPHPQTRQALPQPVQASPSPSPSATPTAATEPAPAATTAATTPAHPSPAATTPRPGPPAPAAVVLPSSDADYLNNPAPVYPRMSRRMGEQGTVVVRVLISMEGLAEKAEIRTSSGYPRLDEAALATVQRWRYVPGKRAGVAEAMWFNVPIRFVLD